ncbi:MAG: rRNA pseudouridine synthase [Desulfobacterales bacterium]|nr:MAG: rRNA pseudouridine synthase [Desulfobacterales bacterium]
MPLMRLQKYLSAAGVCSRRKGEGLIQDGRISVNGVVVSGLGTKVDPDRDLVEVDGNIIHIDQKLVYIALNKPKDYVTSCRQKADKIVVDLLEVAQRVYPVGRLDKDTTGLLILTNDGRLHHKLSHPSFDHEKEYEVTVVKPIADGALQHMAKGLPMMGTKTRPARVKRISARRFRIILQEGKNRQIRRMVRKVGNQVTDLKRVRIANVKLGKLPEGAWRHLTKSELSRLLQLL